MNEYHISALNIYPVKSLGGIAVEHANAGERGFEHDRRWMIVDKAGRFITQREHPKMALVRTEIENDKILLKIQGNGLSTAELPLCIEEGKAVDVDIWSDLVKALWPGLPVDAWISSILGMDCRLVYLPDQNTRLADGRYAPFDVNVSFADSFPYLMIGQSSLDDLNSRLKTQLPMKRFRPNIVVTGSAPFEEDSWKKIKVGDTAFHIVKPCARCAVTTIDMETGQKGVEPLKTLATFRNAGGKVLFGWNMVAEGTGQVFLGQKVEVLERKQTNLGFSGTFHEDHLI